MTAVIGSPRVHSSEVKSADIQLAAPDILQSINGIINILSKAIELKTPGYSEDVIKDYVNRMGEFTILLSRSWGYSVSNSLASLSPSSSSVDLASLSDEKQVAYTTIKSEIEGLFTNHVHPSVKSLWEESVHEALQQGLDSSKGDVTHPRFKSDVLSEAVKLFVKALEKPQALPVVRIFKSNFLKIFLSKSFCEDQDINLLVENIKIRFIGDLADICSGKDENQRNKEFKNFENYLLKAIIQETNIPIPKEIDNENHPFVKEFNKQTMSSLHDFLRVELLKNSKISNSPVLLDLTKQSFDLIVEKFKICFDKSLVDPAEFESHLEKRFLDLTFLEAKKTDGEISDADYGQRKNTYVLSVLRDCLLGNKSSGKEYDQARAKAIDSFIEELKTEKLIQNGCFTRNVSDKLQRLIQSFNASQANAGLTIVSPGTNMGQSSRRDQVRTNLNPVAQNVARTSSGDLEKVTRGLLTESADSKFETFADHMLDSLDSHDTVLQLTRLFTGSLNTAGIDSKTFKKFAKASFGTEDAIIKLDSRRTFEAKASTPKRDNRSFLKKLPGRSADVLAGTQGDSLKLLRKCQMVLANKLFGSDNSSYKNLINNVSSNKELSRVCMLVASAIGDRLLSSTAGLDFLEFILKSDHKGFVGATEKDKQKAIDLIKAIDGPGEGNLSVLATHWTDLEKLNKVNTPSSSSSYFNFNIFKNSERERALEKRRSHQRGEGVSETSSLSRVEVSNDERIKADNLIGNNTKFRNSLNLQKLNSDLQTGYLGKSTNEKKLIFSTRTFKNEIKNHIKNIKEANQQIKIILDAANESNDIDIKKDLLKAANSWFFSPVADAITLQTYRDTLNDVINDRYKKHKNLKDDSNDGFIRFDNTNKTYYFIDHKFSTLGESLISIFNEIDSLQLFSCIIQESLPASETNENEVIPREEVINTGSGTDEVRSDDPPPEITIENSSQRT